MTSFGIDLGTTNSIIAQLVDGVPRALPVDGDPIVPSTVLYAPDGRVVVGREARNLSLLHPERVVRSVKRRMGQAEAIVLGELAVTPERVSAEILQTLARAAEAETGVPVREVVITVPAYFNDAQRRATLTAGELAGLHVLRLLNEPTAASLVYDHVGAEVADSSELVLVYDLGGGTFDVSILEVFGEVREVRSTTGDTQLGGDDFDQALVELFVEELRELGVEELDLAAMARLTRAAEAAKIALSKELEVEVREEFIASQDGDPVHLRRTLTRREFEALITDKLAHTIELARRAIDDAALQADERLARICLVGGSTRIPLVRTMLAEAFEIDVHEEIDVDLAVGLGATIQAGMLSGEPCGRVLVDVAAHTLGLRVCSEADNLNLALDGTPDSFAPLLRRNTALPAERNEEFYTMVDQQELVHVEIYQGEAQRCSQNTPVGSFDFELEPSSAGTAVRFRIAYDLDGVVRVTASQADGPEKTVALELPDASRGGARPSSRASVTARDEPKSAVLRRATRLLASVEGPVHARLHELIEAWHASEPARRAEIEDELLDLFLDIEAAD